MPYLIPEEKIYWNKLLNDLLVAMSSISDLKSGHMNYLITKLCLTYLNSRGKSYATFNEIIGVLECAKLEFYRRKVSLYEEEKISENGDVY